MPRTWFEQLVVSSPARKPRSAVGVAMSIGTHAVLAASLVVIPALGRAQLPETEDLRPTPPPFVQLAPAPPTPPPQRVVRDPAPVAPRSRPTATHVASAPAAQLPTGAIGELDPSADPAPVCLTGCDPVGEDQGLPVGASVGLPDGDPAANEPVRVGAHVKEPRRIHYVEPGYPELARIARLEGMVILECVMDEGGRVTDVKVLRGHELLAPAAVEAVRQWRYTPTLLNGVPVRVVMTVTVRFTLGGK